MASCRHFKARSLFEPEVFAATGRTVTLTIPAIASTPKP